MKFTKMIFAVGTLFLFMGGAFAQTVQHCGHTYETVQLNGRTWLKTNIKAPSSSKTCCEVLMNKPAGKKEKSPFWQDNYNYANPSDPNAWRQIPYYSAFNDDFSDKHGGIFNYFAVEKCDICPSGYRLPTEQEFVDMVNAVGGKTLINSHTDWGAIGRIDGYGSVVRGRFGEYWTASEDSKETTKARAFVLAGDGKWNISSDDKRTGCYVRCIESEAKIPDITKKDGVWTFGWGSAGEQFNEFEEEKKEGPQKQITRKSHRVGTDTWWSVAQNTTNTAYQDNAHDVNYPAKTEGAVALHPGAKPDQCAKARFTASADGQYVIHVKFQFLDAQFTKNRAEVWSNSSKEFNGKWGRIYTEELTKDMFKGGAIEKRFNVSLKKGEMVSIEIEGAGSYANDHTLVTLSAE